MSETDEKSKEVQPDLLKTDIDLLSFTMATLCPACHREVGEALRTATMEAS